MSQTSTFSFASGNAKKVASLPRYLLGKLASFVVPRSENQWVFGSGAGIAEGALPVYLAAKERNPRMQLTWLVSSVEQQRAASSAGIHWVKRDSWQGFWVTLRASTIVITHGFGDVNRYAVFGAFVVQLWHGIPLKKLHLDTAVTLSARRGFGGLLRRMYRAGGSAVSLFVVASPLVGERMRTAFNLKPSAIAAVGDPRDDELIRSDPAESKSFVRELLGLKNDRSALVLYAPTWRDGEHDPAVPREEEWAALEEWADNFNARIVVRAHPLGVGSYHRETATRVHPLTAEQLRDITPLLAAFDAVITDYSSIAFDFSLTGSPVVWFAPDLESYERARGFYEPYKHVTEGTHVSTWAEVQEQLTDLFTNEQALQQAQKRSETLATRLFGHADGLSAERVLDEIERRQHRQHPQRDQSTSARPSSVYFESFYGRQVSCNPAALDREIARVAPGVTRYWGVVDESVEVPAGATRVVEGSPEWQHARASADLIVVNDWLKKTFTPGPHQTVLQTWHGTMLKKLALERSGVSPRTRFATLRESRKWDILLSQNTHCTEHLRKSYGYRGPVWQVGYPRDDELITLTPSEAKKRLGIAQNMRVVAYAPTWRESIHGLVDMLDVESFANELSDGWMLLVRGHTRTHASGEYPEVANRIVDVSKWPNVNDVIAASDLFVTDYSSLMFDASVASVPMAFYVPDLEQYQAEERGFTLDFLAEAPGPMVSTVTELLSVLNALDETKRRYEHQYARWRQTYNPHDDGHAARRVVERLVRDGYLSGA